MSNSTSPASSQFLAVHSSAAIVLYAVFCAPTLIQGGLYLVALVRAQGIDWKMKVLLINNFVPDMILKVSDSFNFPLHPVRAYTNSDVFDKVTCFTCISLYFLGVVGYVVTPPLFAFSVYYLVKYNIRKLKWCVIVFCLSVSWAVVIMVAAFSGFSYFRFEELRNGFCYIDGSGDDILILTSLISINLIYAVCVCVTAAFTIASYRYMRTNTISQDSDGASSKVRRAFAKVLTFETSKIIFQFVLGLAHISFGAGIIQWTFDEQTSSGAYAVYYFLLISFFVPPLISPILSVVFLKAVRDAFKQMLRPLCSFAGNRALTSQQETSVQQVQLSQLTSENAAEQ